MIDLDSLATVIRRELVVGLRSGASFALLLLGMLAMNLVALSCVLEADFQAALSAGAFRSLYALQIRLYEVLAFLVLPAVATLSVQSERTAETQELLATTLIRPSELLLGKYIAVLCCAATLAAAFLPFIGLVYFYAGIEIIEAIRDGIRLVATSAAGAAIGLFAGTFVRRPVFSVLLAYIFLIAPMAPLAFGLWVFEQMTSMPGPADGFAPTPTLFSNLYLTHLLVLGIIAAFYLGGTLLKADKAFSMEAPVRARSEMRRLKFRPIPDGANPFAYRDRYGSALTMRGFQIIMAAGVLFVYGLPVMMVFLYRPSAIIVVYEVERILMLALVPPLVALALTRDRDPYTQTDYHMTPYSSTDQLWGRLHGLATLAAPFLVSMMLLKTGIATVSLVFQVWHTDMLPNIPRAASLEPVNFPHHLVVALLASALGAAAPRGIVPAILGAYLACLVCGVPTLAVSLESVARLSTNFLQLTGYGLAYVALHSFICLMTASVAGAICAANWGHPKEAPMRAGERGY